MNARITAHIVEPPTIETDTKPIRVQRRDARREADGDSGRDNYDARGGCLSRLFGVGVFLGIAFIFAAGVALSAYAGARDGGRVRDVTKAQTQTAGFSQQATLALQDLANGQFALALERCQYIVTSAPTYPGASECVSAAQLALAATATPTATAQPSITPPPSIQPDAQPTSALVNSSGSTSSAALLTAAQTAYDAGGYEEAEAYLEALRGQDANFERARADTLLYNTYLALAGVYRGAGQLSQMVIVVEKAGQIKSLDGTDWTLTVDVTKRYLSAKGYLDAQNYALSAQVFATLMPQVPGYLDTKQLACQAFSKAGDTGNYSKYCG